MTTAALLVEGHPPARAPIGATLLEACEAAGIPMDSACGGFAACNSCRVEVLGGGDHLSPRVAEEDPFLDGPDQRLGCQARILGDLSMRLAPGA
ncbi:MAG: 2Fe-2S iron-sulfur cluster-binding protein [Myxococcota bacterium]